MDPDGRNHPGDIDILKRKLQSKLNIPRLARMLDAAEVRSIADIAVGVEKLRMVKNVEELGAEFEVFGFADRQLFLNGEIEVIDPGSAAESTR